MEAQEKFEQWALLELMGHRRLAGRVTEATIAGGAFIRIDIPQNGNGEMHSQFYSPQAVYCIMPISEDIARKLAGQFYDRPISPYEVRDLIPEHTRGDDGGGLEAEDY